MFLMEKKKVKIFLEGWVGWHPIYSKLWEMAGNSTSANLIFEYSFSFSFTVKFEVAII